MTLLVLPWEIVINGLAHGYRLPTTINYLVVDKLRSGFSLVIRKTINHPIAQGSLTSRRNKITRVIYNHV